MKNLFFSLMLLISLTSYSQITFEKGYIIKNNGEKQTGLIKNVDWRNNPTFIEYKKTAGSTVQKLGIKDVKAFEINNSSKYERYDVKIDRSSDDIMDMSTKRNPEFQYETLFLKVLVEGDANLYQYTHGNLTRFFYKTDGLPVTQLVYKRYLVQDEIIKVNNDYKQKLFNTLHCPSFNLNTFKNLDYNKKKLVDIFNKYNKCKNSNYKILTKKNKSKFRIIPKLQIRNASVLMRNVAYEDEFKNFGTKISPVFGVELEYTLPFNKNKWAVSLEPSYQNYSNILEILNPDFPHTRYLHYSSIELPINVKYNIFLNSNNRIFIDAGAVFDFPFSNDRIDFEDSSNTIYRSLDIKSVWNLSFGIGYALRDISIEFRFHNKRNITTYYTLWESNYSYVSLVLGYKIFEKHF